MKSTGLQSFLGAYEMEILVDNKPITEYYHEGNTFVEGRFGSAYTIRLKNNTGVRGCAVLSVDGLSVLNGQDCSDNSPGYLINPYETLDVACYKVSDETGAKFVFGTKDHSYSVAVGKGAVNVGVIGAVIYREQKVDPIQRMKRHTGCFGSHLYGGGPAMYSTRAASSTGMASSLGTWSSNSMMASGSLDSATQGMMNPCGETEPVAVAANTITTSGVAAPEPEAKLGTIFGEAMSWQTQVVTFRREATPAARLAIYYDTRKNLERRGVKLEHKIPPLPNAFPANNGCPVPDNWQK